MTVAIMDDMIECTDTAYSTITINANPTVDIQPDFADNKIVTSLGSDYQVAWYADLELTASVTGGAPDYDYLWTSNDSLVAGTDVNQTAIHNDFRSAGTDYKVVVTDANGCVATITKHFYSKPPTGNAFIDACDGKQFPANTPVFRQLITLTPIPSRAAVPHL